MDIFITILFSRHLKSAVYPTVRKKQNSGKKDQKFLLRISNAATTHPIAQRSGLQLWSSYAAVFEVDMYLNLWKTHALFYSQFEVNLYSKSRDLGCSGIRVVVQEAQTSGGCLIFVLRYRIVSVLNHL